MNKDVAIRPSDFDDRLTTIRTGTGGNFPGDQEQKIMLSSQRESRTK